MRLALLITVLFLFHTPIVSGQPNPGKVDQLKNTPAKIQADSARLNLLLKISRSDSVHRDYLSAIRHLNQYLALKDSLLDAASKQELAQLQQEYQTTKKDKELGYRQRSIGLLTRQNALMATNLEQTRLIRNMVAGGTFIVALLLLISYYRVRLKKRSNHLLELQQEAIFRRNESLEVLAVQKDTLLEEKELLIKEIHHRVKNNLQVVISLLNTQSAYLQDAQASAAIRQSQHRMQSISLIHQMLYQSESRALINISDYARELVAYLRQSFDTGNRIGFKLDVIEADLDVLRAVPIGLILNETITNAIKYAFPGESTGMISIRLSCVEGQQLKLEVTDDGPGLPPGFDPDICKSLGLNLIKGMCRELNGSFLVSSPPGLCVTVDFLNDQDLKFNSA